MPEVIESLTATTRNGLDPQPGQTVKFECNRADRLVSTEGAWPITKTTDSKGQARVLVKGGGKDGMAIVTCKWIEPVTGLTRSASQVFILAVEESPGTGNATVGFGALSNPLAIPYQDTTTYMSNFTGGSRTVWANTGRVGFVTAGATKIIFREVMEPSNESPAYVPFFTENGARVVCFNTHKINGDPTRDPHPSSYARIEWRHHALQTANHELGHALGLDHPVDNPTSLMDAGVAGWFVWRVEGPITPDLTTFYQIYP